MHDDGSAESGRTRLARGTKPNAPPSEHERADGASVAAVVPAAVAPRGADDARVRSALLAAPGRAIALPAIPGTARPAARPSAAPQPGRAGSAPTAKDTAGAGPVAASIERTEIGSGDLDGSAGGAGGNVSRGIDARGSGPVSISGVPSSADRASAQSICEAVEQLIEAREADEAIAEWMQGGG